jgi:DNA-binding LytR/AlgR family response regulator
VIFTTAYPDFALESYNVSAMDYLLKPIEFERFYKSVKKILPSDKKEPIRSIEDDFIFLKTEGKNKFTKVMLSEVQFFQGLKNYVALQLEDKQIITYSTLKHFNEALPEGEFVQIHKSYIVAIKHIDRIENDAVWIQNHQLPLGNTYRKNFFEKINQRGL